MNNWFEGIHNMRFAAVYNRTAMPNDKVCEFYLSIPTTDIIKNWFHAKDIGKAFNREDTVVDNCQDRRSVREKAVVNFIRKHDIKFARKLEDFLLQTNRWKNDRFYSFVDQIKPDIVFSAITGSVFVREVVKTVITRYPRCKYVGYIADDVYGVSSRKQKRTIEYLLGISSKIYGASQMLCCEYSNLFHMPVSPLYKGCRFTHEVYLPSSNDLNTIKLVYAGNLYYGRDETLYQIIDAIVKTNTVSHKKIQLIIYSGSPVDKKLAAKIKDSISCTFMGKHPYQEVVGALANADIVLHVESFSEKWKKVVRYSFSTKIVDCLESGSAFMAVGPQDVASISAAKEIPGAIVVTSGSEIPVAIQAISSMNLEEKAKMTRKYAEKYHSISAVQKRISVDFEKMTESCAR